MQKRTLIFEIFLLVIIFASASFKNAKDNNSYQLHYSAGLNDFTSRQLRLIKLIDGADTGSKEELEKIKQQINVVRSSLKGLDFWFRYLEPISYKKINGPLPVEWETEVFEKFEKPYKRIGAGLTLAALYLNEETVQKDSLLNLIRSSVNASQTYSQDSITEQLDSYHHFYLCNRLFLLNLAAIYTTGFECPDATRIIPELRLMLSDMSTTYQAYNQSFTNTPLPADYLETYNQLITFVNHQPADAEQFDHFTFIRDFVNPLFTINQQLIRQYKVVSKSYVDYSLNKAANTIFTKSLYRGQNAKGIFLRVQDEKALAEIDKIGKLLFYDPILSGNNLRSCASCHKPDEHFTDTLTATSLQFDRQNSLPRNSPSLINTPFNHLVMADGMHTSLQDQTRAVITSPIELACAEKDILKKVLSCKEYKTAFQSFLKLTPEEPEITLTHISSAITHYYSKFSKHAAPFDEAMNSKNKVLDASAKKGFNVFMSKAQCATCHFVPQFNGVKPPFVGSEFEVLGVPQDTAFKYLSGDKGRYMVNPAYETQSAFRTGTIRNAEKTKPYMHNGVFKDLNQVISFYDAGGGAGRGLQVPNQTLSADSLHLTPDEKNHLLAFIRSLNEEIVFEKPPAKLPTSKIKKLNIRQVGGEY